jgi:DeoR/GlpR family transcriptional regulator of sugar metabolism
MFDPDLMTLERQERIIALVNEGGGVTVAELSERFGVSETTIRRDLAALAARSAIRRVHGGAMRMLPVATTETPILQRQNEHAAEKDRIGAATVELVQNGETLLIAGGSTGLAVACHLHSRSNLTIVTDSLLVTDELLRQGHHTLILLGGTVDPNEQAVRGTLSRTLLRELQVDKVIVGAKAVSVKRGLSAETAEEAELFRAYMACGHHVILVADSSKFHQSALVQLAPLDTVHILITDSALEEETAEQVREMGIYLLTV